MNAGSLLLSARQTAIKIPTNPVRKKQDENRRGKKDFQPFMQAVDVSVLPHRTVGCNEKEASAFVHGRSVCKTFPAISIPAPYCSFVASAAS